MKLKKKSMSISCETRMMENVNMGRTIKINNECCSVELNYYQMSAIFAFAEELNQDLEHNTVYGYIGDMNSDTGIKEIELKLSGTKICCFTDADNKIVVLTAGKKGMEYCVSKRPYHPLKEIEFGDKVIVSCKNDSLSDLLHYNDNGKEIVVMVTEKNTIINQYPATGYVYYFENDNLILKNGGLKIDGYSISRELSLFRSYKNTISLIAAVNNYNSMGKPEMMMHVTNLETGASQGYTREFKDVVNMIPCKENDEHDDILFIGCRKDSKEYSVYRWNMERFSPDIDGMKMEDMDLAVNMHSDYKQMISFESNDSVKILALNGAGVTFCATMPKKYTTLKNDGMSEIFMPIGTSGDELLVGASDRNGIHGYGINGTNQLFSFIYSIDEDAWKCAPVQIEVDDNLNLYNCYHSELSIRDEYDLPDGKARIGISSAYCLVLEVSGKKYFIEPDKPIFFDTNADGKMTICQAVDEIYASELFLTIKKKEEEVNLCLNQSFDSENKIFELDALKLMEAKKADGSNLLKEQYKTIENATALTCAFKKAVGGMKKPEIEFIDKCIPRLIKQSDVEGFALFFEGNTVTYHEKNLELLREQIIGESHDGELFLRKSGLLKKIKSKVSAVMKAAAKKIFEVTKTVIVKVKDVVHHVIEFVKDGVAYFIDEIMKLASQVADAITIIFNRIEVFFQDLMEFLGFILNWSDIKAASHYIGELYQEMSKTTNEFMLEELTKLDTVVEKWGKDAHSNFGKIKKKVGNKSILDILNYSKSNNVINNSFYAKHESAFSNNIFLEQMNDALRDNLTTIDDSFGLGASFLDDIVEELTEFIEKNKGEAKELLQKFIEFFKGMTKEGLLKMKLSTILDFIEEFINASVIVCEEILSILSLCLKALFDEIYKMVNKKIEIPFFSLLWKKITGGDCTVLNMISLVLALPFTIIAKTVGFDWKTQAYKENLLEGLWSDSNHSNGKEGKPASRAAKAFAILGPIALVIQTKISVLLSWTGVVTKVPKGLSIILIGIKSALGLLVAASWITPLVFSNTQSDRAINGSFIVLAALPIYFDVVLTLFGCCFDAFTDAITIILNSFCNIIIIAGAAAMLITLIILSNDNDDYKYKAADAIAIMSSAMVGYLAILYLKESAESTEYIAPLIGSVGQLVFFLISVGCTCISSYFTFHTSVEEVEIQRKSNQKGIEGLFCF